MADAVSSEKPPRLVSLDAYRGFVMLAMVSSGFGFATALKRHPEIATRFDGTPIESIWHGLWQTLAYQFEHVPWTGCAFWDLIQPSFMFMVGVSMPFSFARRAESGQSPARRFAHVLRRSLVLILLGIFLSSQSTTVANFTFVNVLTQIGLGYTFLYLLLGRRWWGQFGAIVLVLGGYGAWFYAYTPPTREFENVTTYLRDVKGMDEAEWSQFDGPAAHWNKHTNAAAAADRRFLNLFPRNEKEWNGRRFWVNGGGYQTLNFIPSLATMIFGLMAGGLMHGDHSPRRKFWTLMGAGLACLAAAMAADTSLWPVASAEGALLPSWGWTLCPAVKRIWSPTWAVFSSGWAFVLLAGFYRVIDMAGWKRWAFPLIVVGMNSIAMYVMAQLLKPWVSRMGEILLTTLDAVLGSSLAGFVFGEQFPYAIILERTWQLAALWLFCLWLYRQRFFVRI